ncbi:right-handed parallel beta-helix repeat-containing protein [Rhodoblastus acidophilus]|uniref:Right-handed parallel beta-helix repeat-containing protein n=1 Tax=Candidatus Rhodoblastus alkanivorans TaxID=2954117 RepID=A0ABS9ZA82_9HYPH|nr:right-handed parallel beta-helix repeat-containing protein [Candidatus Rhodoblastus alkanivorans]MCI4677042.1 right-handed parallel beta-helix repeat-containing protein [Candidatus Rhodoblastus alkanivorans]MCI4684395.1 right-handed parallel beta-helix repeat-containing protein [Candidatus Rhodoblastus alkanivorans]MDI4641716.1 right-handed parallel beta-helix repeat-containing protein [Rhodoblastus acidophilus]
MRRPIDKSRSWDPALAGLRLSVVAASLASVSVPAQPAAAATARWPDAANTGAPANVALQPSGELVITKPGAVVSGRDIHGAVTIKAPNVTIVDCRITAAGLGVVQIAPGVTGAIVKNSEINGVGSDNAGSNGINGEGTFIGNNIYNVENGVNVTGPSVIRDNYIHDLLASGSPHYDGVQIDGGHDVTISHNTIINPHGQTSAIMIDNYFSPVSNIKVDGNRLVGGGYTVYSDGRFKGGAVSGVSFTNNRMGKGRWGYSAFEKNSPVWRGNVDDRTGANLGSR